MKCSTSGKDLEIILNRWKMKWKSRWRRIPQERRWCCRIAPLSAMASHADWVYMFNHVGALLVVKGHNQGVPRSIHPNASKSVFRSIRSGPGRSSVQITRRGLSGNWLGECQPWTHLRFHFLTRWSAEHDR
jgi:hypothetical protein